MEDFIKRIEDLYTRSKNKNIITYTGFLTPAQKQLLIKRFCGKDIIFSGGVKEAERVRAFFLPDYINEVKSEEYIKAIKVLFSFKKLTHRDFLGALLALGLERKCIGDIYVFEKEAYIFVTSDVERFVKDNLNKVGSVGIKIEEVAFGDVKINPPSFSERCFTVQSLRLDSIVSGAIKESREKTSGLIKNGIVLLNYLICESPSKEINEGDIFSVKGYGKFKVTEVGGFSKHGKIFIKVAKYI